MVYKTYSSNKSIRGATPHKNFIQDDIEKQVQKIFEYRFIATENKLGVWPGGSEKIIQFG